MRRLRPLLLLGLAACSGAPAPPEPLLPGELPRIRLTGADAERAWFEVRNETDRTFYYQGYDGAPHLPLSMVQHRRGAAWETCGTALWCGTGVVLHPLAPGAAVELWLLFDEPAPTRIGLEFYRRDFEPLGVAWSELVAAP